jgi:hypothetical protein
VRVALLTDMHGNAVAFRAALADQLSEDGLEFLRGFQPTVQAGDVLCCHATPLSNEDVILPETNRSELERALANVETAAVAAGHAHVESWAAWQR